MDTTATRTPYASDGSDEEWAFLAPYLTVMREDAPQRTHTGLQWRNMAETNAEG
jgi:hypothetical protein